MQACDRCHARKTRCDRRIPRCGACEKAGAACLHVDKLRSRNLPRGYVETVETDLQKSLDQNLELRRQIDALRNELASKETTAAGSPTISVRHVENEHVSPNLVDIETSHASIPNQQPIVHTAVPTTDSTTSSRTPADDAVASEVGYLTLTAAGETRYLGSSSGMGLANIISSVLDSQHAASGWPGERNIHPRSRNQQTTTSAGASPIPPRDIADEFITAYFQHTHITFPLLHRPSFMAAVKQIYDDPSYYSMHTFDAFAFDMVLSIGSSNFNRFEESMASTAAHYASALTKMKAVLNMSGLIPLQAILLLSQHGIFSNLRDTSGSIWHLIGMGARICFELGLHLEPKRLNQRPEQGTGSNIPVTFEVEMRKRTFWCLYNLDRVVSFTLGRPVALRDEDIDISYPSHLLDEEFGPDRPISLPVSSESNPSGVSPFLHLIRIRHLSGKILSTMYAAKQKNDATLEERVRVRQQLSEEIIEWRNSTASLKLDEKVNDGQTFISCFLSPQWYEAVANNALLLLYRPSPYLPYPALPTRGTGQWGDLQHMFNAARSSITSYYKLHRNRQLNYSWITLHGVFIAGLAYVYGLSRALKDPTQGMPIPDYLDIINDTRACSNVLVAICERWNVARSSCDLFNRLSIAVIKDAIIAATKRDASMSVHGHRAPGPSQQGLALEDISTPLNAQDGIPGSVQHGHGDSGLALAAETSDHFEHMFVADEFRNFSSGLDSFPANESLPSELIMGFSQDWPFDETHFPSQDGYDIRLPGFAGNW